MPKKLTEEEKQRKLKLLQLTRIQKEKEKLRIQLEQYKATNKIEFFEPFPHQKMALQYLLEGKKTVMLQGANQIGKTILGANVSGTFSLGCKQPWGEKIDMFPSEFARLNNGRQVVGRILCNDWEKAARDTIVPKLKEWLPVGSYETKKNNVGVEHEFIFPKTGSKFTILTYKEDTKSHEGWTGDWVWCDEPPPKDKYTANRRGLVARNGLMFISMTALDEPWLLDDIVLKPDPSVGIVADIPIQANTTLSAEAIRIFEKDLPENEKVARIQGGWMQLTGRVWKGFGSAHIIEPFKIPPDWPVAAEIDFHLNLPHAISFCAVDQYGRFFICDETWENMGSEDIADDIIRKKQANGWRMNQAEVDALSKGDTSYIKNRFHGVGEDSFTIIERKLRKYGIRLGVGSKDEKSYINAVEQRLKGPNGMPTLFVFNTCKETIKQIQRWTYDDNGKPKSDGHFPECIGRFTQMGLKYTPPNLSTQKFHNVELGIV